MVESTQITWLNLSCQLRYTSGLPWSKGQLKGVLYDTFLPIFNC